MLECLQIYIRRFTGFRCILFHVGSTTINTVSIKTILLLNNVLLGSVWSLLYLTLSSPHSIIVDVACIPSARHASVAAEPL